jgi:hypothetical protein
MVKFKDLAASATKFTTNGSNAAATYVKNAGAAGTTWHDNTAAAEPNYVAGVQAAAQRGAFGKGVNKAGAAKYTKQIAAVAGPRFSDGIGKAGPSWNAGFAPLAQAVSGVDIGPRGPRGSPQNKQRAGAMADAWRAAKLAAS